jgi:signal transduction histidine kinase
LTEIPVATFVQNAALLLAVAVVFDAASGRFSLPEGRPAEVVSGLMLGVIGISIMLTPFQFAPGLFFDSRIAFLSTTGLFFGAIPGVLAAAAMSIFRVAQGGGGVLSALAVIWVALGLGVLWRQRRRLALAQQTLLDLWLFGVVSVGLALTVAAVGLYLTVPPETARTAVAAIAVPVMLSSPIAVALLGSLLANRLRSRSMAATNERLQAQVAEQLEAVRASRARIVEATDLERRRLERDLHDGAQQRLLALVFELRLAKAHLVAAGRSPDQQRLDAVASLDAAITEANAALAELRELARGIHPQVLTEAGLGPAIGSLVARAPVPVDVDVVPDRFPPAIESAAYFVVAECLTNIARYARATRAVVRLRAATGRLVIEVVDDGVGGADPQVGTGLRGLADRLAVVEGSLDVHSPSGVGTRIVARIPVPTPSLPAAAPA